MRNTHVIFALVFTLLVCGQAQTGTVDFIKKISDTTEAIKQRISETTSKIQETISNTTDTIITNWDAMMSTEEIARIQAAQRTWSAEIPEIFQNKTMADLRAMISVLPPNETEENPARNLRKKSLVEDTQFSEEDDDSVIVTASIPSSFDSRTRWPGCVGPVRQQGQCGACWAFATVQTFEDRLCIAGKTKPLVQRSTQYLLDCDTRQSGCNGGNPNNAWKFLVSNGAPSESCYAYKARKYSCPSRCSNGGALSVAKATRVVTYNSINSVKTDIMTYGPVESWMSVYQDFYYYKSGVYQQTSNALVGYHAVKIVGWGYDTYYGNYWIVQNSWGASWGEKGFFRIRAGSVQIDALKNIVAGYV